MNVKKRLFDFVWTLMFVLVGTSWAAPHNGDIFSLLQPDGSRVDVKVYGDEFYQRVESMDGLTLIRDPETDWICYAEVTSDGETFVSTGIIYHGVPVADWRVSNEKDKILKLHKHLRLRKEAIKKKVEAGRAVFLSGPEETMKGRDKLEIETAAPASSILGLTILIEFPDVPAEISQNEIEKFCNQVGYTGYGNNGSVRDYFYDVSNQNLEYTNYVTPYYTAKYNKSYYDDCSNGRARELLGEALNWLGEQGFDFTILSLNANDQIIGLNAFYAGSPDCGWAKGLWPHKSQYTGFTSSSGVKTRNYQISNIGNQLSLGTFCHENGHLICGWPDLYDTDGGSRGVGGYCLMAASGGKNPKPPNPYLRDMKGWETIIEIENDAPGTLRFHRANSFTTHRYSHPTSSKEFFLVESRLKTGRHAGIPDEGLLIWHIDEEGSNSREQMTPQQHYRVSVEQADGVFHLERDINGGGSGDLFHAGHKDSFNDYTIPDAQWWDGVESGMRIINISGISTNMSFVVDNMPIELLVTPGAVQEINGLIGGPFGPSTVSYTLTNLSSSPIEWTASKTASWLTIPRGGILAPAESTVVNVNLTSTAESLLAGTSSDTVLFTDTTNGPVRNREIELVVDTKKLIAHWKFDSTSGTVARDSTGHGHDGTLLGNMSLDTSSTTGRFGRALNFDGANDTVYIEGFTLPKSFFTIALWFNPDDNLSGSSSRDDLLYWEKGSRPHLTFNMNNTGKIGLFVNINNTEYDDVVTSKRSWSASTWYHIAVTFDGTVFKVYVNGQIQNTIRHPGIHFEAADPYIGSRKSNNSFFDGQIDDVRFYNSALPSDAVHALYIGGRAENPVPEDFSTNVSPYTALQWLAGSNAIGHDVYLGRDLTTVANATTSSSEYKGRLDENFLTRLSLNQNTEYFWRVDEVISGRGIIDGVVWSFVTGTGGEYEVVYEAEDAYLSGPETASNHSGYTGSGFVDYVNATGDYVEWTVFANNTGSYDITFRYALNSGNRPLEIKVNGQVVDRDLSFPATGDWSTWSYTNNLSVTLSAGYNTVRATAIGYQGPNIDHLKLTESR